MRFVRLIWMASIAAFVLWGLSSAHSSGQDRLTWTPQARIPVYEDFTEDPPFVIADNNRTFHAFNSQQLELHVKNSPRAVFYREWTPDGGWTDPLDILIGPDGHDANVLDVFKDPDNNVHLVFTSGQDVYYTKAALAEAGHAHAWSKPVRIGAKAIPPYTASIVGDSGGNLVVIYSGSTDISGVFAVYSSDAGATWSQPEVVFVANDIDQVPAGIKMVMGASGRVHAVWNVFDRTGTGISGHYASLDLGHRKWTTPVEVDQGGIGLGIKTINVIEFGKDVIVTYYGGRDNANWWRRVSEDGAWSTPLRIAPDHIGTNGIVSLVADSNNILHGFFGQRIDDNHHGLWHVVWTGDGWTPPVPVVVGPQVKDKVGGNGFDPRSARGVIANGNLLLVTWATDGASGANGAWYSSTTLNTPALPLQALPAPTMVPTALPTASPTAVAAFVSAALPKELAADAPTTPINLGDGPGWPLVIGIVPAALVLVLLLTLRMVSLRRR